MQVVVGTENQVKVDAVRETIQDYDALQGATVSQQSVSTGVSEQPLSKEAIVKGARNRAKNAFGDCDYSFGIESGFMQFPSNIGHVEVTVCVVYDGQQFYTGVSPGFECPPAVMEEVRAGVDLSEACVRAGLADDTKIGQREGIVGYLTKNRKTRKDYTKDALVMALVQLENDVY